MRPILTAVATVTLLSMSAALAPAADMDAKAAVEAANDNFETAFNKGDSATVAGYYTDDAALLPPGAPRVEGHDAIVAFWQGAIDQGLSDLTLTTVDVESTGKLAAETGTLTAKVPASDGSGKTDIAGKYMVIWKQGDDGTWRLFRDTWNMGQ